MFFFVLCIYMIEPSISQLQQHVDLQKVGETIFNNEKYKILKPVTHHVTDYFKDYMLAEENTNFPTKRLFVDDNSFRHYWSGFDKKTDKLIKPDNIAGYIQRRLAEEIPSENKSEIIDLGNFEKMILKEASGNMNGAGNVEANNGDKKVSVVLSNEDPTAADIEIVTRKTLKWKEIATTQPKLHLRKGETTLAPKKDGERKIVKTTFFCPFLGVISMSAFID